MWYNFDDIVFFYEGDIDVEINKTHVLLKKTWNIMFFVLSGLLLLYILFEIFIPQTTVKVFQFKPYVVITASMEPVINVNDMAIVVNPTNRKISNLEVGDIITFEADINYDGTKEIVTHYIFSITETDGVRTYRTNRYGSTTPDTWVLRDNDILGIYAFRIPWIGNLVNFVRSPYGIVAISVNIIVIGAIIYIVKTGKKEKIEAPQ